MLIDVRHKIDAHRATVPLHATLLDQLRLGGAVKAPACGQIGFGERQAHAIGLAGTDRELPRLVDDHEIPAQVMALDHEQRIVWHERLAFMRDLHANHVIAVRGQAHFRARRAVHQQAPILQPMSRIAADALWRSRGPIITGHGIGRAPGEAEYCQRHKPDGFGLARHSRCHFACFSVRQARQAAADDYGYAAAKV